MTQADLPLTQLRALFDAAVSVAQPHEFVHKFIPESPKGRLIVLGAGKASAAMGAAFEAAYEGPVEGTIVTRYGHAVPCNQIDILEAAHPVPDDNGAKAAKKLLEIASSATEDDLVVMLISGGGSALLTLLPEGCDEGDRVHLNRALLASGASIDEMNCIRRHLSLISGGRLARAAYPAPVLCLMISDVPGDNPVDIASGPTVGDPTTLEEARALVEKYGLDLPQTLTDALQDDANETIKPDDPCLAAVQNIVVAAPSQSLDAASDIALGFGWDVENLGDEIEGEARDEGRAMAQLALGKQSQMAASDSPLVLISGGETTVTLPQKELAAGKGGRNVDFLMGLFDELSGAGGIYALACDTDGIDGAAEVAGAMFGPAQFAQGSALIADALNHYDGHGFFEKLGTQIITGPTLTNVNDFRAVLVLPKG